MLEEIQQRLRFLDEVGLDYLTLDRLTSTLSGGETQRIQLATSLGSSLVGALYVLDEPSIGLHPRDTNRLIQILKGLRDLGNTLLLVVEHDPDTILAADHVLDLGPGAGEHGGNVTFAGTRDEMLADPHDRSPGGYLRGELRIAACRRVDEKPRGEIPEDLLEHGSHNLKNVDVMIPLGLLVWRARAFPVQGKSTLTSTMCSTKRFRRGAREAIGVECLERLDGDAVAERSGNDRPVADRTDAPIQSSDLPEGV